MWGFLGGKFGGDKWGFLIDIVGIFSQDLPATLYFRNKKILQNKEMQLENEDQICLWMW